MKKSLIFGRLIMLSLCIFFLNACSSDQLEEDLTGLVTTEELALETENDALLPKVKAAVSSDTWELSYSPFDDLSNWGTLLPIKSLSVTDRNEMAVLEITSPYMDSSEPQPGTFGETAQVQWRLIDNNYIPESRWYNYHPYEYEYESAVTLKNTHWEIIEPRPSNLNWMIKIDNTMLPKGHIQFRVRLCTNHAPDKNATPWTGNISDGIIPYFRNDYFGYDGYPKGGGTSGQEIEVDCYVYLRGYIDSYSPYTTLSVGEHKITNAGNSAQLNFVKKIKVSYDNPTTFSYTATISSTDYMGTHATKSKTQTFTHRITFSPSDRDVVINDAISLY